MSCQAVSSQFQHNKNDCPIPPLQKVVILQPAPSIFPPSSKSTSEKSHEVPHTKVNPYRQQTQPPSHDYSNLFCQVLNETATSNTPQINITVRKVPIQAPQSSTWPQEPPHVPPTSGTEESEPQQTAEEFLLELAHPPKDPFRIELSQFHLDVIIKLTL
ncbi:hypothetical protein O181_074908 [Austropuccinia psidii MF-1]|uniref:Uncharacterized protein n=1 Tax=Austropuccinia psidii MF-1 TaxID=1389203 RepID=A0A9Q3IBD6_9BASI|nr:hypothetical protein [Austropuccinia psidii MF-1]